MNGKSLAVATGMVVALAAPGAWAQCVVGVSEPTATPYCGWGKSVAISGDGLVALVGGPSADDLDGVVRTFEFDGAAWVEGTPLFPDPYYAYGAEFGWSVALSYDGNTAAVGAPGDLHALFSGYRWGAVYVFTRDPGSGEWSRQARLIEPNPGMERSFGHALALSDSGDHLVVGQKQHLGDQAYRPDSAWIFTRAGDTWSAPVELVGTDLVHRDDYSYAVAVASDGSRAVVSALGEGLTDGRVFVFREDGGAWPIEQILEYPEATGWNSFGNALAIQGDQILVGDAWNDDPPPGSDEPTDNAGAVHIFRHDGDEWVREPDFLAPPLSGYQYMFGYSLALRGDHLLVGCPYAGLGGVVHLLEPIDGKWIITGKIEASEPEWGAEFGWSIAVADGAFQYVIGEPEATVNDVEFEGRAHFVDSVSAAYDYDVAPTGSPFTVTFYFLGIPVELQFNGAGDLVGIVMDDCDDAGALLVTEATLVNDDDPLVLTVPIVGWEMVISDVLVTVSKVGSAAALDESGVGTLTGYVFEVSAWISIDGGDPRFVIGDTDPTMIIAHVSGGYGEPFEVISTDIYASMEMDWDLGDYNPTVVVQGTIDADEVVAVPCPGDVDGDGDTDQGDLGILLSSYELPPGDPYHDPRADLNGDGEVGQPDLGILLADYECGA